MKLMLDNDLFDRQDRPQSKRLMAALKGKDLRGLTHCCPRQDLTSTFLLVTH